MFARNRIADSDGLMRLQVGPHAPGDPEQQQAADEQQALDIQQLLSDRREDDAQHQRDDDAPEDRAPLLHSRQRRGRETNRDGVVARERQVDQDDLKRAP